MVAVETNKGRAAALCMTASRAAYSCSQINSGDVGMAVREHPWEKLNGDRTTA